MRRLAALALAAGGLAVAGCSGWFWGGAAAGAAGAGAYYEHENREELRRLEDDFEEGRISKDDYLRRKREIEERSIVY